jgi:pimeloyl-ACP methyl ester carboxylesterase
LASQEDTHCDMSASLHPGSHNPVWTVKCRPWLGRALATALILTACIGGIFYWRPLWVIDESTDTWLRLAGVRSEYVQLGPFRIHYLVGGRGQPLVLVHGLDGRAENWARLMPTLLRHGHRVYAIDLLGFGRSDRPEVDYSIKLQAEVLNQFFDSQNLGRVDLGGWSMGGWVALKFALDHPQRVRRIFVADSAGLNFKLPFDPGLFQPVTVDQAQQLLALLTPQGSRIPRFVARDIVRRVSPMRWVVERATTSMMAGGDLLDGKLGAIRIPVLIVWGKQDALIPPMCGEEMHREMPQSLLTIIDGCGHLAPVECSSRVMPETLRFLEAEPPLPPSVQEFPQ